MPRPATSVRETADPVARRQMPDRRAVSSCADPAPLRPGPEAAVDHTARAAAAGPSEPTPAARHGGALGQDGGARNVMEEESVARRAHQAPRQRTQPRGAEPVAGVRPSVAPKIAW